MRPRRGYLPSVNESETITAAKQFSGGRAIEWQRMEAPEGANRLAVLFHIERS